MHLIRGHFARGKAQVQPLDCRFGYPLRDRIVFKLQLPENELERFNQLFCVEGLGVAVALDDGAGHGL